MSSDADAPSFWKGLLNTDEGCFGLSRDFLGLDKDKQKRRERSRLFLCFKILVILSDSEVSINSKRKFVPLKRGFFILNLKCVLNSVDISLTLNMTIWIFRYAQNDKTFVILSFRKKAKYP